MKEVFDENIAPYFDKVEHINTVVKYLKDIKAGKKPSLNETVGAACALVAFIP